MKNANTLSVFVKLAVTAVAVLLAAGCGGKDAATAPKVVKSAADYFPIKVGGETVRMQLAVEQPGNQRELNRGLMGRRDLAEDQGMIFVYQHTQRMGFFMRNTPTPLDIGFFTKDGVLREVRQMFPFDETSVASTRADIHYALEMNQGWFGRRGLKADGSVKLDLEALADALKQRGFRPEDYGLAQER